MRFVFAPNLLSLIGPLPSPEMSRDTAKEKSNIRNIKLNQNFFDFLKLDLGYAFFQIVRYSD